MKLTAAIVLATAGSLVAAQAAHHHGHRHHHKRDNVVTTTIAAVEYVYQLDGASLPASEVCNGVKEGRYLWADGTAPAGACAATSTSTPTPSATPVAAADFFETPSSSTPSPSSTTPTSTITPSSTTTPSSTAAPSTTSTPSSSSTPLPTSTSLTSSSTSSSTSVAVTSSSAQPQPSGSGGVTIKNNVGQTIYLWTTSDDAGSMVTLPNGQTYQESWLTNPDAGGISIKIATTPEEDDVMQFEYTLLTPIIWWDVSLINLLLTSLFDDLGFTVTSDNPNCFSAVCPPGDTHCSDAYLWPSDDQATHSCDATTNMVLNLGPA